MTAVDRQTMGQKGEKARVKKTWNKKRRKSEKISVSVEKKRSGKVKK